ncbi:hypothetical protein [Prevotella pallens]|uniref:hypothetical protein n=1 Tax=Prevotella pallens TaxID=60133 RepID=UPI0028F00FF9|nr:hypothetical protein [Prevotella pallens]
MKNDLYKSMCAAFAVLFVSMAQQGMAQDTYNIKIAGVSVTSENCNNLSVIKGVTGKAKYDNDSKTLTLDGATITSPTGAYWEEVEEYEYPYFYLYGANRDVVTDWVVITKGSTGIKSVATDTKTKKCGIYTLDGSRVNNKIENLPAGMYIVNGQKFLKK